MIRGELQGRLVDPESGCSVPLRIQVDQQRLPLGQRQAGGEVDSGSRLADPALLIRDCDDASQSIVSFVCSTWNVGLCSTWNIAADPLLTISRGTVPYVRRADKF